MKYYFRHIFFSLLMICFAGSFVSYGQRQLYQRKFVQSFVEGKWDKSLQQLNKDKYMNRRRQDLLLKLCKGSLFYEQGLYDSSNVLLEDAHIQIEDFRKKLGDEALAMISSDNATQYPAEDFERLMVYYYKALNFIRLGSYEKALVEAKRMDFALLKLSQKYKNEDRFQKDAFIYLLMGVIYDANGEINDAFIAYRNAYEVYKKEYVQMLNVETPLQLKKDLLRTSYQLGFEQEYNTYKKEFKLELTPAEMSPKGQAVVLWHNGAAPIKTELVLDFLAVRIGRWVYIRGPFNMEFVFHESAVDIGDQPVYFKVALPRYAERYLTYTAGRIEVEQDDEPIVYPLSLAEDINAVTFKTFEDKLGKEMGRALMRSLVKYLTKQAIDEAARQNMDEGAALVMLATTITNAVTERADTRSWMMLPHSIYYTRIPLSEGEHELTFKAVGKKSFKDKVSVTIRQNQTSFVYLNTGEYTDIQTQFEDLDIPYQQYNENNEETKASSKSKKEKQQKESTSEVIKSMEQEETNKTGEIDTDNPDLKKD